MTVAELIEKLKKLKSVDPGAAVVVAERGPAERRLLFDIVDVERIEFSDRTHLVVLTGSDQRRRG